jgi:hypothetical protein
MPTTTPILSTGARAELFFAVVLVALFLYAQDDLAAWLTPHVPAVQMSALGPCREPTEHEVLLISYVRRDGKVVRDGCTYAGSQSAYPKQPRPKVADAHAHD